MRKTLSVLKTNPINHQVEKPDILLQRRDGKVLGKILYDNLRMSISGSALDEVSFDVYKVIDEYNEELSIETWQEDNYFNIEDNMFNSYSILPILFYNENIAVNDNITGVTLDCNGNIDFSAIRK